MILLYRLPLCQDVFLTRYIEALVFLMGRLTGQSEGTQDDHLLLSRLSIDRTSSLGNLAQYAVRMPEHLRKQSISGVHCSGVTWMTLIE